MNSRTSSFHSPLRIGTRGSPLALKQTDMVIAHLMKVYPSLAEKGMIEIVPIKASGDYRGITESLAARGGKGLFAKELEEALLDNHIDIAVHSLKDLPTWLPEGLMIGAVLEREDPRDVFLCNQFTRLQDLPKGAIVGTASVRRQSQLLAQRSDLNVVLFRGNVDTRLKKLDDGEVDATLLALAGLKRLGYAERLKNILSFDEMLPAVAQGAVGVEVRMDRIDIVDMLDKINHPQSFLSVTCERAFLDKLDGTCRTPIAGFANLTDDSMHFRGLIAKPDGTRVIRIERTGSVNDSVLMAIDAAEELLREGGRDFFHGL